MKDGVDGREISPLLSMLGVHDDVLTLEVADFSENRTFARGVPVKYVETDGGKVAVATVFDLIMAQFGVSRGLPGEYPERYEDEAIPYTPAWQEKFTGIEAKTVLQFAREFASTAEKTEGRCSIIIGAGVNHWYHNNLMYRAGIVGLILCGCVGKNGGGGKRRRAVHPGAYDGPPGEGRPDGVASLLPAVQRESPRYRTGGGRGGGEGRRGGCSAGSRT